MSKKLKLALIIAQPSPLRDALRALITTMTQVEIIAETSSIAGLTKMQAKFQPDLVVLDANLEDEDKWQVLTMLKSEDTQVRSCVLVENDEQHHEAEISGADLVIHKGFPAADLAEVLEELLTQINDED